MNQEQARQEASRLLRFEDEDELAIAVGQYLDALRACRLDLRHLADLPRGEVVQWLEDHLGEVALLAVSRELGLNLLSFRPTVMPAAFRQREVRKSLARMSKLFAEIIDAHGIDVRMLLGRDRAPADDHEWAQFVEDAKQQRVVEPLSKVVNDSARVELLLNEILLQTARGSGGLGPARVLEALFEAHKAEWLIHASDAYLTELHTVAGEPGATWLASYMSKRRAVRDWFVALGRNSGGRRNAWTKVETSHVYDEDRGVPQLRMRIIVGQDPVFETVDDVDDLVRLGLAIARSAIEAVAESKEEQIPDVVRDHILQQLMIFSKETKPHRATLLKFAKSRGVLSTDNEE